MKFLVTVLVYLMTSTAMAGDFFMLDMEDVHLTTNSGRDVIGLRRELRNEYPGLNLRKAELLSVMAVAKTAVGRGTAKLVVGGVETAKQVVAGTRPRFRHKSETSFDRVLFKNPKADSLGKWQIHIHGNFKVRQVMVELDLNPLRHQVLNYGHMHVRTGQGDDDTLYLRAKLNQQHGINTQDYEIVSATIFAKSRRGGGTVQLKVGGALSDPHTIGGNPASFVGSSDFDYHRIKIANASWSSDGVWQMKLRGNIKIQKVVLEVKAK